MAQDGPSQSCRLAAFRGKTKDRSSNIKSVVLYFRAPAAVPRGVGRRRERKWDLRKEADKAWIESPRCL